MGNDGNAGQFHRDTRGGEQMSRSKHEGTCGTCGNPVVRLPYSANPSVRIAVEPQSFPTSQVAERDRWSWVRGQGLVSMDGHPKPPPHCLVVHPCSSWFAHHGSSGRAPGISVAEEEAATAAVEHILQASKAREREYNRERERKRYEQQQ